MKREPFEMTEHWDHEKPPGRVYARDVNWTARERIAVEMMAALLVGVGDRRPSCTEVKAIAKDAFGAADALIAAGKEQSHGR